VHAEKTPEMRNCDISHVYEGRLWIIVRAFETDRQTDILQAGSRAVEEGWASEPLLGRACTGPGTIIA